MQICNRWCLHPYNEALRLQHSQLCAERADRAESRAVSEAQECCICLERVMEKPFSERRFGLLACEHAFCLRCVRDWRSQLDGEADLDSVSPPHPSKSLQPSEQPPFYFTAPVLS